MLLSENGCCLTSPTLNYVFEFDIDDVKQLDIDIVNIIFAIFDHTNTDHA